MLEPAQTALLRRAMVELRPRFKDAGLYFFHKLFALDPGLRGVCGDNSVDDQADRLMKAIEEITADPKLHTGDLGGTAKTVDVTSAVIARLNKR